MLTISSYSNHGHSLVPRSNGGQGDFVLVVGVTREPGGLGGVPTRGSTGLLVGRTRDQV